MSVKSSIRNFNDIRSFLQHPSNNVSTHDTANVSMKLSHITKMVEDTVMRFTKRFLIVSTELEEMKREFISQSSLINEYLILTKKEIRFDTFDKYHSGKASLNIAQCPGYEQKCLIKNTKPKSHYRPPSTQNTNKTLLTTSSKRSGQYTKRSEYFNPSEVKTVPNQKEVKQSIIKDNSKTSIHTNSSKIEDKIKTQNKEILSTFNNHNNNNNVSNISYSQTQPNVKNDQIFINKHKAIKSTNEMNNDDKKEYHYHIANSVIQNGKTRTLYNLINSSDVLSCEEKMQICYLNKDILLYNLPSNLLYEELRFINDKIQSHTKDSKRFDEETEMVISQLTAYPSKTAEKGMNYLTHDRESELMKNDGELERLMLNMIFVCLNESANLEQFDSLTKAYEYLFRKYNCSSIKKLFMNVIYKNIYENMSCPNKDEIIEVISSNKDIMTESLADNTNKIFSYIAFSLEEILEFLKIGGKYVDDNVEEGEKEVKEEIMRRNQLHALKKSKQMIQDKLNRL